MSNTPQSPADIVNRAIVLMGGFDNNQPISGTPATNFNGTPLGQAAAVIYGDVVQTTAKEFGWDFQRSVAQLALSGGLGQFDFSLEYLYPTNGIEVLNILPPTGNDPNNPIPPLWTIGNSTVNGITSKVIWCDMVDAVAAISGQPPVSTWDAAFVEAVVRGIASALGMGAAGRPETTQLELERAGGAVQMGKGRAG